MLLEAKTQYCEKLVEEAKKKKILFNRTALHWITYIKEIYKDPNKTWEDHARGVLVRITMTTLEIVLEILCVILQDRTGDSMVLSCTNGY
jgi:hypothetical protein